MSKLLIVVGTRPNFIKITQFRKEARAFSNIEIQVVHTGQHYDSRMADVFFSQFGLIPDFFLNVPPGSANFQMAHIMLKLEETIFTYKPDLMLVVGDVNSTFAAALCANKTGVPLAHLESGLRSHDRTMPEEFNRILTDLVSDYFFITEQSGYEELIKQGIEPKRLFFVGNTMIDTLVAFKPEISNSPILDELDLDPGNYVLMTMHRPATVDFKEGLEKLLTVIEGVTTSRKLVFPIHPRTRKNIEQFGLGTRFSDNKNLLLCQPLDYFSFQKLVSACKYILTDSGGIQEESTFLQIPCLTLRPNTERPVTVEIGSNELVPFNPEVIASRIELIEQGRFKKGQVPPLWDGKATARILHILSDLLPQRPAE